MVVRRKFTCFSNSIDLLKKKKNDDDQRRCAADDGQRRDADKRTPGTLRGVASGTTDADETHAGTHAGTLAYFFYNLW